MNVTLKDGTMVSGATPRDIKELHDLGMIGTDSVASNEVGSGSNVPIDTTNLLDRIGQVVVDHTNTTPYTKPILG